MHLSMYILEVIKLVFSQAFCLGLRGLKERLWLSVDHPHLTVAIGNIETRTEPIANMSEHQNFGDPLLAPLRVVS